MRASAPWREVLSQTRCIENSLGSSGRRILTVRDGSRSIFEFELIARVVGVTNTVSALRRTASEEDRALGRISRGG